MWHIDTTVIRLLGGTRAYLHAVIDNFSRRILAWRVADTFAPVNSVAVLLEATRGATRSTSGPVVLADAGVENVNAQVDALIETGVLRRLLAFTELKFSNSMIDAWWRSLKHQWLFLHPLENVATIRRVVTFYVDEHNHVLPHSAFRGQTPDEMYFGTGDAVPVDLTLGAAGDAWLPTDRRRARRARLSTRPHDSRRADRRSDYRPLTGVHLGSCPGLLPIKTGATRRLERGKTRPPSEPDRARPTRRCRRTVSGSGLPFLAALGGENSRQKARMSVRTAAVALRSAPETTDP